MAAAVSILVGLGCSSKGAGVCGNGDDMSGGDTLDGVSLDASPDVEILDAVEDFPFEVATFSHNEAAGLSGMATGTFETPSFEYPPIPVDADYTHLLNFMVTPMMPPYMESLRTHGPLILYTDSLDVIVFSPMNHFFDGLVWFEDGSIHYGLHGEIQETPADFEHRFVLVKGHGIQKTLEAWGDVLLEDRGKERVEAYADRGLSHLSYWTDNGAYYYYKTEDGLNEADTLLAVKADADARGIPLGSLQLDSWWYFKVEGVGLAPPGGLLLWEPIPEMFPDGLQAFQKSLDLPLILHNRWFAKTNQYKGEFDFVDDVEMSFPLDMGVYQEFAANAKSWGAVTYEQDWLVSQYWGASYLRQAPDRGRNWMLGMDDACREEGLTMQLCMTGAAHLMQSVDMVTPTTVRTSIDYSAGISKESYWPQFHTVNMVAWAVGLWPFKDNFHSSESHGEAEALICIMNGGMVGAGDAVGAMDADILLRTCRSDGLLLKPDRPAFPVEAMFLPHSRPYTVYTSSDHKDAGKAVYVAAYNLAENHPERTPMDIAWAALSYDELPVGKMFQWPAKVTSWTLDLEEVGVEGPVVAWNWRTGEWAVVEDSLELQEMEHLYDFDYVVLVPVLANGLAVVGEPDKFISLSTARFKGIQTREAGGELDVAGVAGESVNILVLDTVSMEALATVTVGFNEEQMTTLFVGR